MRPVAAWRRDELPPTVFVSAPEHAETEPAAGKASGFRPSLSPAQKVALVSAIITAVVAVVTAVINIIPALVKK